MIQPVIPYIRVKRSNIDYLSLTLLFFFNASVVGLGVFLETESAPILPSSATVNSQSTFRSSRADAHFLAWYMRRP
jgi:hypothetical protein